VPSKIPHPLAAVISPALLLLFFYPNLALAQLGYSQLKAEQGANLAPTSGSRLVYIAEESNGWRYWTGDLGSPSSDWRLSSFVEPAAWQNGQASIGYGDSDDNTSLGNMRNNYTSVYLRHQFSIAPGGVPALLHLRLYVDDAAIVWLNGIEIARANVTTLAPGNGSTATTAINNAIWQDFFIAGAGAMVLEGTNTIAIHGLNATSNSSDFSIDIELARPRLDFGQVEAASSGNFMPSPLPSSETPAVGFEFQGSGTLSDKTFELRSVGADLSYGASSHAGNVATYSYRSSQFPGFFLTNIKCWSAGDFVNDGIINSGNVAPDASFTQIQNHSWISTGGTDAELNDAIRRFDYMAARDKVLCAIGLNNGSDKVVPQVWGCSYNSIVIGRVDGGHSRGGTVIGVDGPGRIKPDLVSPGSTNATSYSTANVSGMAALLLGHAYTHPELSAVFNPEVNKAIIMAGASKTAGWSNSSSQPLDQILGAGTANILNSFDLLVAGEHGAGASPVPASGWDYAEINPTSDTKYTFLIQEETTARTLSVILTWFRQFGPNPEANGFADLPTLADFELRLYQSQGGALGNQIALSDSAIDNVEHLYLENLPAGEYTLTIATDTPSPYAIAWQTRADGVPEVVLDNIASGSGAVTVNLENLITGVSYTLQYSVDLSNWSDLYAVTASSETETFTQVAMPIGATRGFYRIVWTP
jgi:hypothetical protein